MTSLFRPTGVCSSSAAAASCRSFAVCPVRLARHTTGGGHARPPIQLSDGAVAVQHSVACRSQHEDVHEARLGPDVVVSVKDFKDGKHIKWHQATITRNDALNIPGTIRLIHLSIEDHVDLLYGRRVRGVNEESRWINSYTNPGQLVGVRVTPPGGGSPVASSKLYAIARSPYEARRDSSYLEASLIEIVAERHSCPDDDALVDLGPGSQVEVSQVIGRGFTSLLNTQAALQSALEEGRNLLLIGVGTKGITPLRSVLNWTPVLAHATKHKVAGMYVARSPAQAAFLTEWDAWRDAGATFTPLYSHENDPALEAAVAAGGGAPASSGGPDGLDARVGDSTTVIGLLQDALFHGPGGLEAIVGARPSECVVLFSGLPGDVASALSKSLAVRGVEHDRMLYCDYF